MIDGSQTRNRQLAFELQNSHVCEKRSKEYRLFSNQSVNLYFLLYETDCVCELF